MTRFASREGTQKRNDIFSFSRYSPNKLGKLKVSLGIKLKVAPVLSIKYKSRVELSKNRGA
ncbi:MAG: hypothetical protein COV66_05970 [Nitrospinae bacterium CG11_big_fil_rev_8_21_14_0_20_45_15]|nr:MAG: hypothetical protein COV66_05970 [Nitrospinae bacterium CG11_big_fil_rev_8_21_14_0_20_45_15]